MNARSVERALARLAAPGAVLAPSGAGFGVFPRGDKRRRPAARLEALAVRALEAEGALERDGARGLVLSRAGHARVRREAAEADESYLAQHAPVAARTVMDGAGAARLVRGLDAGAGLRRLTALRGPDGEPWLSDKELAAAAALRGDWERAQMGLVRGSDWRAPPRGSAPRGVSPDAAMAARCDARRRLEERLSALAPMLRRVVERACFEEHGLEALERAEGWPARSGKLALKLGLAQLAQR